MLKDKSQVDKQREIFDRQIHEDIGSMPQAGTLKLDNWMQSYLNRIFGIFKEMRIGEQGKILDIGCGAFGWIPVTAMAHGFALSCGIEISLMACRYADIFGKRSVPDRFPYYAQCSADSICFKGEVFDAVTCIALLEHVVDDDEVIGEMARILKSNGIAYIMVPNDYKKIPFFLRWYYRRVDRKMGHLRHYSRSELIEKLSRLGFVEITFYTSGHMIKMFQYLLTVLIPALNAPSSRLWWFLEKLDLRSPDNDYGVTLTVVARKG